MANTRFYLDMRSKAKDGKGSVVILLYHNSTQTSVSTGVRLTPAQWHNGKNISPALLKQKSDLDRDIAMLSFREDFMSLTASQVKELVKRIKEPVKIGYSVSEIFKKYIADSNLKPKTVSGYDLTLKKIKAYSGDMDIRNMNLQWLKRFDKYLAADQKANGKAVYLRCLRAVMNYARDNDIECPYPFAKFSIAHAETDKRSLSLPDLQKFYKKDLGNTREIMFRDYFFLVFFLIGINIKDLLLAKKRQVRNGRLEYTREKTGKKYSIKIEPEAQKILSLYKGKRDYLLNALDLCVHYESFARQINEFLGKEISGMTTYWARHTWATLAYEAGIPIDTISQALGHSMGNRTTLIYVKPDQAKVDKANRKVIDLLTLLASP